MRGFRACALVVLLACCVTWVSSKRISTSDLQEFFNTYDTNEPPSLDGPTDVRIGIYMNNLLLFYDTGIMRMNIYLRMSWQDERLKEIFHNADSDQDKVTFDDEMIKSTWRPDLFARNADKSEKVDALMTEHLFRVNRTGHAWYVVKMINNLYCPELFSGARNVQCPMMFESFSYTMDTITLSFLDTPVDIDKAVRLRSHTISDKVLHDCSQNYTAGSFPCLEINLQLERDIVESTFEAGIYLVSIILVFISWLGFWIPPSDKRIFLGLLITLILGVLYNVVAEWREFSFADRTTHSQIWLIFCLIIVLGMVLEFAVVYVVFGTLRAKLRGLCGGSAQPEDVEPKRSRCGDIVDTAFGLVIFPAIFIIMLIGFGSSSLAFK